MKNEKKYQQANVTINKKEKKHYTPMTVFLITIIFLLIIFLITSFLYCFFFLQRKQQILHQNTQAIVFQEETIEYGTHLTCEAIIEKSITMNNLFEGSTIKLFINDTILHPNEEYVFDTLGDITITLQTTTPIASFLRQTAVVHQQVLWKVEDTKKPILSGVQDKEIMIGEEVDIRSGITAIDEIDGELEVTIEGTFDVHKAGEYLLTAKAVDKHQNETTQEFKLVVKEKTVTETSESTVATSSNTSTKSSKNTKSNSSGKSSSTTTFSSSSDTASASTKSGRLSLAKAEAKRVVRQIISPGMTNYQKAEAICHYITNTVSVQSNQSNEAYKTNYGNEAYAALVLKIAACSGRCKAVTLLCDAAGLKSQHINQGQWSHQWNKIQMEDSSWIVIDAQIGFVGDKHPLE